MMAADTMEALGIARGDYVVKVSNRKVLDGVLEAIGLGGEANAGKRLTVLRAIDKLDRLGGEGVRLLLGPGRKDESGDFTRGAELSQRPPQYSPEFVAPNDRLQTCQVIFFSRCPGIGTSCIQMKATEGRRGALKSSDSLKAQDMDRTVF